MNSTERRHEIVQIALAGGRVRVTDLAERFDVSEVTIRTDLKRLDDRGILARTHGGAVASTRIIRELSLIEKSGEHAGIKHKLAEAAVALIDLGETPSSVRRAVSAARKSMREPTEILPTLQELHRSLSDDPGDKPPATS